MRSMFIAVAATVAAVSIVNETAAGTADDSSLFGRYLMVQLKSAKQDDCEEHLKRKKAEFRHVVDEIKAENEAMRRKYDTLEVVRTRYRRQEKNDK